MSAPPRALAEAGRDLAGVLFDMDGLLVDSEPLWYEVERAILAAYGASWTPADQQRCVGGPMRRTAALMLARAGVSAPSTAQVGAVERALVDGMAARLAADVPLKPGAGELLTALADAGVPTALVTSSYRRLADPVLCAVRAALGPRALTASVAGDEVRRRKPDPEPYRTAAALLGAAARDCVALEDSLPGLASAAAAGCVCVAVPDAVPIPPAPERIVLAALTDIDVPGLRALVQSVPVAG